MCLGLASPAELRCLAHSARVGHTSGCLGRKKAMRFDQDGVDFGDLGFGVGYTILHKTVRYSSTILFFIDTAFRTVSSSWRATLMSPPPLSELHILESRSSCKRDPLKLIMGTKAKWPHQQMEGASIFRTRFGDAYLIPETRNSNQLNTITILLQVPQY